MDFEEISFLKGGKEKMQKSYDAFVKDMDAFRSGQPNSALVDNVMVDCYGSAMPIHQLALVSVPDAQSIVIEPWDKSLIAGMKRSLMGANLGFSVQVDGDLVRIRIPALSEERREELVKMARRVSEEARVSIRLIRKLLNATLKTKMKEKVISEDQRHNLEEKIQKETDFFIKKISEFLSKKETQLKNI